MAPLILRTAAILAVATAAILVSAVPSSSDSQQDQPRLSPVIDTSYRSTSSVHKVVVYPGDDALREAILRGGGALVEDYGAFALFEAPTPTANLIASGASAVRDDMNLILLRAGAFDTTSGEPLVPQELQNAEAVSAGEEQLYLVQMVGPVKAEWHQWLSARAQILGYIPNNAYLVRATPEAYSGIRALAERPGAFVQWSGAYKPAYRIAPELLGQSQEEITVTVQLATGDSNAAQLRLIESYGQLIGEPFSVLSYTNVRARVRAEHLTQLARMSGVVWIEAWQEPELLDERQCQIVAGNVAGSQLTGPGYLNWLRSKGLGTSPDFVVDIADSGLDRGSLDPSLLHRDLASPGGASRIAYARFFGAPGLQGSTNDITGHGTLNASIVGGYNDGASFPDTDSEGYRFGLGVHPLANLGITKIFNPDFTSPNLIAMVDLMYASGARVSSNSWGSDINTYTTTSQAYDAMVRDAQNNTPGNQEMSILFASGNKGLNRHVAAPANAKNVIAVGATENFRPTGTDGCNIPNEVANDVTSVISFSGGGPVDDGRTKPDIVAPGTHIQGAQSQDPAYTGRGVCGPKNFPPGQTLYTWSSGTSHSTPAVAGGAALVRQYFQQSLGRAPSPAMLKAFLLNSTAYLTGNHAADNLPSNSQGWGLLNLGRALDSSPRILVDQDQLLTSTGQLYTLRGRIADPGKQVRITLVWTDAPGTSSANPVVNDLDLEVTIEGRTYKGNYFNGSTSIEGGAPDKLNNVESVWLPEGITGEFTVRVTAANIAGNGVPNNGLALDQDFALVAYNAQAVGGGGSLDLPPTASLRFPVGGERLTAGARVLIQWDSSDDKGIQNQWVELSTDGGASYTPLALLDGRARFFNWLVPAVATSRGRIKIRVLDGVNFPVSVTSASDFQIVLGPPDSTPPRVTLVSPRDGEVVPAGATLQIKWSESDNVAVIRRSIEYSTDGGETFREISTITGPAGGDPQTYSWQIPSTLSTNKAKVRVTVFDGSNNSAQAVLGGKFQVWGPPAITAGEYNLLADGRKEFGLTGKNFRLDETEIFVDGVRLKKTKFFDQDDVGDGTYRKVYSYDKKLHKRVPAGTFVTVVVKLPRTGQESPPFQFKRKE